MALLLIKIFITFSTTISVNFNLETFNFKLDTIIGALGLYYTIKQGRCTECEKKKQTVHK